MILKPRSIGLDLIFNKCTGYTEGEAIEIESVVQQERTLRNSPPTKTDIEEALKILKDFQIKTRRVPEFKRLCELELWVKKKIREKLFRLS